jgi:orotidine-5'-phosphate decarboxylase
VEQAINRDGCDVIIVGRGITNPRYTCADFRDALVLAAKDYKITGWKALTNELYV